MSRRIAFVFFLRGLEVGSASACPNTATVSGGLGR